MCLCAEIMGPGFSTNGSATNECIVLDSTGDIAAYVGLSAAVGLILVVLVAVLTSLFIAKRLQKRRKSFRYQQLNTDAPRNYGSTECQNAANGFVCSLKPSGTMHVNFTL